MFSSGVPNLINCTFSGNSAIWSGGMYIGLPYSLYDKGSPNIINCTFSGNSTNAGGGISNVLSSQTVINCTFSGNSADNGGGIFNYGSQPIVINSILWGNTAVIDGNEIALLDFSTINVDYSDVQGGQAGIYDNLSGNIINWGSGNINADPLFVDADGPDDIIGTEDDNLRLTPVSPCIDAGNNAVVTVTTDLDSRPRLIDDPFTIDTGSGSPPVVDMGAYEFSAGGDFDGNGQVDGEDFVILFSWWQATGCGPQNGWCGGTDSNRDGTVNIDDLLDMIINWLAGTGP